MTDLEIDGEVFEKGKHVYRETIYGTFASDADHGMVRHVNATSREELISLGYKKREKFHEVENNICISEA